MRRSKGRSHLVRLISIFAVMTFVGLGIAERGTNELLGSGEPSLINARLENSDMHITLLGMHALLPAMVRLVDFHATPDAIALGPPHSAVRIDLQIEIPHSEIAMAKLRTLVMQAAEAGFGASRALYRWWGSRGE